MNTSIGDILSGTAQYIVNHFIVMGIVGTIVFYPTTNLPAYAALLSIVLGPLSGIATVGDQVRETNKIDFLKHLISAIFLYCRIWELITFL
jgi:hypothetical protein